MRDACNSITDGDGEYQSDTAACEDCHEGDNEHDDGGDEDDDANDDGKEDEEEDEEEDGGDEEIEIGSRHM
eukprot:6762750-Pyramimonas_sp.AAC.1